MTSRSAIAQYEATVILVVLSLSLASVVYSGIKRESNIQQQPVFVNVETLVGGNPPILAVTVNASASTTVTSLSLDEASSVAGVLAFDGNAFTDSTSLCSPGKTTLFSVDVSQRGTLAVSTNGVAWASGSVGTSFAVQPGWHEVMISNGSTCTITMPGGQTVSGPWTATIAVLSSLPLDGSRTGPHFAIFVAEGGGAHSLLLTSAGGLDSVAL